MRLATPRAKPSESAHASESCSIRRRNAPAGRGRLPLRTSCTLSQIRLLRPCRVRAYRFASGAGFVTAPYSPSKNATRPTDPQGAGATGRVSVPGSESPRATKVVTRRLRPFPSSKPAVVRTYRQGLPPDDLLPCGCVTPQSFTPSPVSRSLVPRSPFAVTLTDRLSGLPETRSAPVV
jgi:hypothetical protein